MFDYGWYAARFGWTPEQVDRIPAWIDARMPAFMGVWDEVAGGR
jgi:hypothetical protein